MSRLRPDPNAIFLWLSDSPELNLQSKDKIEAASDIFPRSQLVIIDNDFDRERLSPGHIYFLNTQKARRLQPPDQERRRPDLDHLADHREHREGLAHAFQRHRG